MADPDWSALRQGLFAAYSSDELPPQLEVPMLSTAVTRFCMEAEDPDVSPKKLAWIIESDAGLTVELLRTVNSPVNGLRNKASSVQQAIAFLGLRACKLLLLTVGIHKALKFSQSRLVNFNNFWAVNYERALFAQEVARLIGANAELAYTGGMLQDFLLPVLTNKRVDDYVAYLSQKESSPLDAWEQQRFGWNHAFAAAMIMALWKFPDDIICCTLLHHRGMALLADPQLGRSTAAAVAAAALIPDPLQQVPAGMQQLEGLADHLPGFDLFATAEKIHTELQQSQYGSHNHISLLRRCERVRRLEKSGCGAASSV